VWKIFEEPWYVEFYSKNNFEELMHLKSSSPVTGPEWPRGFQEVKVPSFRDNGTGWW